MTRARYSAKHPRSLHPANRATNPAWLSWEVGQRGNVTTGNVGRARFRRHAAGVTTNLTYDGADLVAEYDGAGILLRRYVHGPGVDEPLVAYERSGTGNKRWQHVRRCGRICYEHKWNHWSRW
jgi:hypothetical protein